LGRRRRVASTRPGSWIGVESTRSTPVEPVVAGYERQIEEVLDGLVSHDGPLTAVRVAELTAAVQATGCQFDAATAGPWFASFLERYAKRKKVPMACIGALFGFEIAHESPRGVSVVDLTEETPGVVVNAGGCPHCSFTGTRAQMRRHVRQHTKPEACQFCGHRFAFPRDRRRHERTHGQPESIGCHCGKTFTRQDNYTRHLRKHQGEGVL